MRLLPALWSREWAMVAGRSLARMPPCAMLARLIARLVLRLLVEPKSAMLAGCSLAGQRCIK